MSAIRLDHIDHISFSSIDLYHTCPWSWLQTYVEGLRSPGNHYSDFGSCIHTVLEKWGERRIAGEEVTLNELIDHYESIFPFESFSNSKTREEFKKEGIFILQRFFEHDGHIVPLMVEKKLKLHIEGVPEIELHIDRIDGEPDRPETWSLQDYKSGKAFTEAKAATHLQSTIYMMAIKQNYGCLPKEFLYKFLKHSLKKTGYKIMVAHRSDDDINLAEERIKQFWQNVKDGKFEPNRSNEYFCNNFCFHKNTGCLTKPKSGWDL